MPPFPERDSSILAKLKKKKPATADIEAQEKKDRGAASTKMARPAVAAMTAKSAQQPQLSIVTAVGADGAGGDNKVCYM